MCRRSSPVDTSVRATVTAISSLATSDERAVASADLVVDGVARQRVERCLIRPLPAQARQQKLIDLLGPPFDVERDVELLGDPADHAAPVVEKIGESHVRHFRDRLRECGDPVHVIEPQREPFRHGHVAARFERTRNFERITQRHDVDRPEACLRQCPVPQRRQQADARVLDQNRRLVAVRRGEHRAQIVHDLVGRAPFGQRNADAIPGAAKLAQHAVVECDDRFRLPESGLVVVHVPGHQLVGQEGSAKIQHARERRRPAPVHPEHHDGRAPCRRARRVDGRRRFLCRAAVPKCQRELAQHGDGDQSSLAGSQDSRQQEHSVFGPLRRKRIGAGRRARQHRRDEITQHPICLNRGPRRRLADRVAVVQTIEVERAPHDHGLSQCRGAQAEVPVVIEAHFPESAERQEELALDKEIAGGHRNVGLHERETVRGAAEESALKLPVPPRGHVTGARRVSHALPDLSNQRKTPAEPGARYPIHHRRHAVGRVIVVRVEERQILAARHRGALVQGRWCTSIGSSDESYREGQAFDLSGDDVRGPVRRTVVDDNEFEVGIALRCDRGDRLPDVARMVVRRHDDGNERRRGGPRATVGLLPRDERLDEGSLPVVHLATQKLGEHQPQIVANLRLRPTGSLRRVEDEFEGFAVPQPFELDDAEHVEHIDVVRVLVERAPVERFGQLERARPVRGECFGARGQGRRLTLAAAAVLESLAATAGAGRVATHRILSPSPSRTRNRSGRCPARTGGRRSPSSLRCNSRDKRCAKTRWYATRRG